MSAASLVPGRVRAATLTSVGVLLGLLWSWRLNEQPDLAGAAWAFVFSLPLLLPLRGLVAGRRYTYAWATLCVMPYLIVGITETVANPAVRSWAAAVLGVALLLFFTLIGYLRVTRQHLPDERHGETSLRHQ